jgi:hypothetical protein
MKVSKMKKQNFLFVVCDAEAESLVRQVLTETCFKNCSERTIGPTSVFLVKGNEKVTTRLGMKLVGLKSSLPVQLEIFDSDGVI